MAEATPASAAYPVTYDAEKAAQAHASFSPADRLNGRLHDGGDGSRELRSACVSLKILNLRP